MTEAALGRLEPVRVEAPARVNILIVDDHAENLLALESVLGSLGHTLVRAASGREALRRLLDQEFAAILLDVQMADMDGFETAALIREREKSKHTPIIFLTAVNRSDAFVFKGYSHGAVDYIIKPFAPEILRAKVSVFVDLFNKTEQVKRQEQRLREIERAEHRRQLTDVENQRNRFFSLSLDMMCIVGFDGFTKVLNSAWEGTLGYTRAELMARPFIKMVHPEDRPAAIAVWQKMREGTGTMSFENRCLHKDGSFRWLLWSATAYAQESVYYAVARDITERKEAEQALRALKDGLEIRVQERTAELLRTNEELEAEVSQRALAEHALVTQARELTRSNAELEQFAYVASHDLREPLRKITGFVEIFARRYTGAIDPEADQYIKHVVGGVARMQDLISGLLEYSRVGAERKPMGPADTASIVDHAVKNLSVLLAEKGGRVTHEGLPTVNGDPLLLLQLFQNLIGNALKFRGEAPPEVSVSAEGHERHWLFSIKDNGIGIDPEYHDRVFAIFKRLHSRDKYPGTGIGLAICKKVVDRHHGRIWVESKSGAGADFRFTIPRIPVSEGS